MKCLFATGVAFLALGAGPKEFGVDGRPIICVPPSEIFEFNRALTTSDLFLGQHSVGRALVIVRYNYTEIKNDISKFHFDHRYGINDSPNTLSAFVYYIPPGERKTFTLAGSPDAKNILDKSATCKQPVVTPISGSGMYLAKCDRKSFWQILFDKRSGGGHALKGVYDTVLAECTHTSIGFGPHKGTELENCTRRTVIEDFRVDYQFQIENADVIPRLDAFLRSKIDSWERKCKTQ
jgi:hypothetical protein